MKAMQAMHEKMRAAKTPAEREALMADHMKAMREGMSMMKQMNGMGGMGGMGRMGGMGGAAGSGDGKGMGGGMAKHHQMMADHNAAMHLMMEMMLDRLPPAPAAK